MRWLLTPRGAAGAAGLVLVSIVTAGAALAVRPAGDSTHVAAPRLGSHVATPHLTANTNAGCNTAARKGFARCLAVVRTPASHVITPDVSGPPPTALGPADIQGAYNLPAAGGGQTVAIVDAFGDSHAEADLAAFRAQYGLPPCTSASGCFQKVDQTGGTSYPPDDAGWALETSLDLDAVSSACPACNILLVEGTDNSDISLGTAVDEAVALGAKYVSNSYGLPDQAAETADDHFYDHPGVAVTAASGDTGNQVLFPSASDVVTAVGGTTLTRDTSVARGWDESAWADGGSGCSGFEPKPDFQQNITTDCANRATADIAADADPVSGLATYDTIPYQGQTGWFQVGGTSLASPLAAAMFALAGAPQPGSYPVNYPYHDPHPSTDLFDITAGTNGSCGNLLCQAGTGWDGPTGLGSPDGVAALNSAPQGTIAGQVTDESTGEPIAGATVSAGPGNYATHTDSTGHYQLDVAAATYTVTVSDYGYASASQVGVSVDAGQTTTENYALAPEGLSTVSGTVTDPAHGWPLYAKIAIDGFPGGPVFTDPVTGQYSVKLADHASYTFHVQPAYPGYQASDSQVQVGASDQSQDFKPAADPSACTAPGYRWNGLTEAFTGWTGAAPGDGWQDSGAPRGWRFDNPGDRPPAGSTGGLPAADNGDDQFAVADSAAAGGPLNATLTSPPVSLSGQSAPVLSFQSGYYAVPHGQSAEVDISTDGGRSWARVWHQETSNAIGQVTLPLPAAADKSGVRVRFRYTGQHGWYWAIDNIFLGTRTCVPLPGGLLTGTVTDHSNGKPVNGAQIADTADPLPQPFPTGISQTTGDPAHPGGRYWLFAPSGSDQFTASAPGYATATATVSVTAGQVTGKDWSLTPAGG